MSITKEIENIGLPKWPALVVQGHKVTREQAMEILVRTDAWYISTNDREWEGTLYHLMGTSAPNYGKESREEAENRWAKCDDFKRSLGVLPLEYLHNQQIASCYVGGPHGWCDWDGNIFTNTYNIGKWPSVEAVYDEWRAIAEAFPFLDLWCQLYSGEQCEEHSVPIVEFVVRDGKVLAQKPSDRQLTAASKNDWKDRWTNPRFERGCSLEQLKKAIALVKEAAK